MKNSDELFRLFSQTFLILCSEGFRKYEEY